LVKNKKISNYKNNAFGMQMDSPITGFIKANEKLYIVCAESINLLETGIEKDPENIYPFSPNTNQKILDKGTNNSIIKIIYEYIDAIEKSHFEEYQCFEFKTGINKDKLKTILFEILINLSTFEDSFAEFINLYNAQLNNTLTSEQGNNFKLDAYIPNLDKRVKDIIITEIGGLLNKLTNFILEVYGHSLSENNKNKILSNDKRIDKAFQIFIKEDIISEAAVSVKFIEDQNNDFLSDLIDIRNALEHRSEKKYVNIINFTLGADRKYNAPKWEIYIHNTLRSADLGNDLQLYSQKILDFIINMIKISIIENISSYYFIKDGSIYKYSQELAKI